MFFLVVKCSGNLYYKNASESGTIGLVEAANEKRAAGMLGLIKWDGWKKGGVLKPDNLKKERIGSGYTPEENASYRAKVKKETEDLLLSPSGWNNSWFAPAATKAKYFGTTGNGKWINFIKFEPVGKLTDIKGLKKRLEETSL